MLVIGSSVRRRGELVELRNCDDSAATDRSFVGGRLGVSSLSVLGRSG